MAATVIRYERGDEYVENVYNAVTKDPKSGKEIKTAKTAHGLVGTLWVGGYAFDTLERMDGYVHLKPGEYTMSSMYDEAETGGTHGLVVNPWLGKTAEGNKQLRNILIHKGSVQGLGTLAFRGLHRPGFPGSQPADLLQGIDGDHLGPVRRQGSEEEHHCHPAGQRRDAGAHELPEVCRLSDARPHPATSRSGRRGRCRSAAG